MLMYLTVIALRAILSLWNLRVHNPTGKPSSSLTGALRRLAMGRQARGWVRVPVDQDASLSLSERHRQPNGCQRREIPTRLVTRLEWLSGCYRNVTNFLGKGLDIWPVSVLEYGISPKRTYRTNRKCRIYHLISPYIILFRSMSDL